MNRMREVDPLFGGLFLAGEIVPPGEYREISGGHVITLNRPDSLPASLDGHVACYARSIGGDYAVVSEQVSSAGY